MTPLQECVNSVFPQMKHNSCTLVVLSGSQFPLGFSAAASVRVGNALGAGNVGQAQLSCKVTIVSSCKDHVLKIFYFFIFITDIVVLDEAAAEPQIRRPCSFITVA